LKDRTKKHYKKSYIVHQKEELESLYRNENKFM